MHQKENREKETKSQLEVQQQTAQQQLPPFNFSEIPFDLRPLTYYAQCSMHNGTQIACPTQQSISGNELGDDFKDLIKLALNDWKILVGKGFYSKKSCQVGEAAKEGTQANVTLRKLAAVEGASTREEEVEKEATSSSDRHGHHPLGVRNDAFSGQKSSSIFNV
ncbi:hypothetical protein TIFTF001_007812 [Ficus carica]|uniref:Uncharacterized protein n=1 Tax=Ficus carica TaxID=3494 RepID=A0AA87ZQZ6_FICCA|nr:hypothetical protein TIFTF001_007812 [Ficus carica]